jgi:hypothetical protein
MAQVVERLPSKCEAQCSNISTTKKKTQNNNKKPPNKQQQNK